MSPISTALSWRKKNSRRASAFTRALGSRDNITIGSSGKGCSESAAPSRIFVVDSDESNRAYHIELAGESDYSSKTLPRPKAIRCELGEIQFVICSDPTSLWNATMLETALHLCWQSLYNIMRQGSHHIFARATYHPLEPPFPEQVPEDPLGAPSSVVEYV